MFFNYGRYRIMRKDKKKKLLVGGGVVAAVMLMYFMFPRKKKTQSPTSKQPITTLESITKSPQEQEAVRTVVVGQESYFDPSRPTMVAKNGTDVGTTGTAATSNVTSQAVRKVVVGEDYYFDPSNPTNLNR